MDQWGPLGALAGEWEGDQGVDLSYHHADDVIGETPYREHIAFKPFGPIVNGQQHLYGLDYKMAAWRIGEDDPFHTELGYWLWCADLGQVMRAFVIPRGSAVLAGGDAAVDANEFTLRSESTSESYGMATNPYLVTHAKAISYEVTVRIDGDTFSYDQDSVLDMSNLDELLHHTDRNTLTRVAAAGIPVT